MIDKSVCMFASLNLFRVIVLFLDITPENKILLILLSSFIHIVPSSHSIINSNNLTNKDRMFILSFISEIVIYFSLIFVCIEAKLLSKEQIYLLLVIIIIQFLNTINFLVDHVHIGRSQGVVPRYFIYIFIALIVYNKLFKSKQV
jgi:hypothetical protein